MTAVMPLSTLARRSACSKRVHQYFQPSHDEGIKKAQMVKQIARFEYIVTDSELEALVLECNLIKEHQTEVQYHAAG